MARYGVNVLKSMAFRGGVQPFGNTYYYEAPIGSSQSTDLNNLIDDIVALEREHHSTNVSFERARLWSADGGPSQNQMIVDRALTSTGNNSGPTTNLDRERAYLIQFRAGVDSKGRPVYLRKWYHFNATTIGGSALPAGCLENTAQLSAGLLTVLGQIGDALKGFEYTVGQSWDLVSHNGRAISGGTIPHKWLEHHQLGDEWRG